MNLSDIQTDIYRRCKYSDTPAASVTNRINGFINQRHRQILSMPGIARLRDDNITFASVASQKYYAMGPAISRIKTIYDGTTNQRKLEERTLSWIRLMDPRNSALGTPEAWIPISLKQVQTQPAAACTLHAISSSASDGASVTLYVEYIRTGGYRVSKSHALNGITDVTVSTDADVIEVDKCYLSAAAVGTVTLLDGLAGNVLATINPGQTYGRFLWIQLWPTPSSVWTYNVDFTREIFDMSNATDEPLLPPDFHFLVALGARIDEYEQLGDSRLATAKADWALGISRLKDYVTNSPDYLIVPGGQQRVNWSNLGSMYPAGSGW